jgi:hypothetical protein
MYKNLPLVTFEYPDSETDYLKPRFVRVKEMDQVYVRGYEFTTPHPANTDNGKFKTYLLAKIVKRGVALLEFSAD